MWAKRSLLRFPPPSLFLIATDLKRLQVWVAVNEADIAQIRKGQAVRFTVDAFPGRVFEGTVAQIRLNATMTQNVVTYTVVVATDNRDEKLLPYLTANVQFEVSRHEDVLLVPRSALRWRPQPAWIAPEARKQTASPKPDGRGRVWVQDGKFVRPVVVEIGPSDGAMTEITGGEVREGMEIIVGGGLATKDVGQKTTPEPPSVAGQLLRGLMTNSASKQALQRAIASMGTNQLLVLPGTTASGGVSVGSGSTATLTPADAEAIAQPVPGRRRGRPHRADPGPDRLR